METSPQRDFGVQPLDALLSSLGLENHDLVAASSEQLTHKQVQKARSGRYVTGNIQRKVLNALQAAVPPGEDGVKPVFSIRQLFLYRP